jgi:hypothetical protein
LREGNRTLREGGLSILTLLLENVNESSKELRYEKEHSFFNYLPGFGYLFAGVGSFSR